MGFTQSQDPMPHLGALMVWDAGLARVNKETGSYAEFSRLLQHTADGNVFKKVRDGVVVLRAPLRQH